MLMPQESARRLFFPQAYAGGEGAQWSGLLYWELSVELAGCGLCSAAMCIDLLTNRDLTPRDVLARYRKDGMDQGTHPWHYADGSLQPLDPCGIQHPHGHIVCVWAYEDGAFLVKDPLGPSRLCNNVRYTDDQMERWLAGNDHQQYRVSVAR